MEDPKKIELAKYIMEEVGGVVGRNAKYVATQATENAIDDYPHAFNRTLARQKRAKFLASMK